MLNGGKINEWNQVATELQNITLLDLVKVFNSRNDIHDNPNFYTYQNDTHALFDIIAKKLGYYDRHGLLADRYNVGIDHKQLEIDQMNKMLDTLAQMYGYYDKYDFVEDNKNAELELNRPTDINSHDTLLRIDMRGNVWIKGNIENNPTRIGKAILEVAQVYKENFVLKNFAEYLNVPLKAPQPVELDDLPF